MSHLPEREAKLAKAFCEGAVRQKAGGVLGDNPHSLAAESNAWIRGFQAIAGPSVWAADTAYTLGQLVTNDGNVYSCVTAGTSDSSGGPTGNAPRITDNTAVWQFQGVGSNLDLSCCGYPIDGAAPYVAVYDG